MKTLRASLIRLAYERPEFRSDLLPLLRKMASEQDDIDAEQDGMDAQREGKPRRAPSNLKPAQKEWWLEGWDFSEKQEKKRKKSARTDLSRTKVVLKGDKIRVRTDDNERSVIYIEELPQSPLKKRMLSLAGCHVYPISQMPGENYFLPVNLLRSAKIGKNDTYDQALNKLRGAVQEAAEEVAELWAKNEKMKDHNPEHWTPRIGEEQVNYLTVEPASYDPIKVKGKDFEFTVHWTKFKVYSPGSDFQQADPHYTGYEASSPAAARKLFQMVSAKPDTFKSMSYAMLGDWFNQNKIQTKSIASNWS